MFNCEACPAKPFEFMYYVYLIKSKNFPDQVYIGFRTDLKERLKVYNLVVQYILQNTSLGHYKPTLLFPLKRKHWNLSINLVAPSHKSACGS
jgi:hypothetical protein